MTFIELLDILNSYSLALTTMSFDAQTIAPKDGTKYRNKALAILSGEYFKLLTSEETLQILQDTINTSDNPLHVANAKELLTEIRKVVDIPTKEYIEFEQLTNDSYSAWEKARETKDYDVFKPYLEDLITTFKKILSYRKEDKSVYDIALSDYEKGLNQKDVDYFFDSLKDLVPFIDEVIKHQKPRADWTKMMVSEEKQKEIAEMLMDHLGYKDSFGYLTSTQHPFSSTFSIGDTRITTHYYLDNFISSIFSVIHEIGHSMYNHQVNPEFEGLPFANNMSYSMHESQSRFLENIIGRSKNFWIPIYPKLQAIIPDVLSNVELDEFIEQINYVEKGLIRTEADELTYPFHIMLRYEVEKALFNEENDANIKDLFNKGLKEIFNLEPNDDRDGILQDVHWSGASFGYFPTYALGSAYAAQFYETMRKEIDIDNHLVEGNMKPIFEWLKENIHQYSGSINTQDLIVKVTNEPFNPKYYVDYLTNKYKELLGFE